MGWLQQKIKVIFDPNMTFSKDIQKKKTYRAEGGIEPLGYYASTDLKSAHRTIEDHPRTLMDKNFVSTTSLYHGNQMWPFQQI